MVKVSGAGQTGGVPLAVQSEPSNRHTTPTVGDDGGSVVAPPGAVGVGADVDVGVSEGAVGLDEPPPPPPASELAASRTIAARIDHLLLTEAS